MFGLITAYLHLPRPEISVIEYPELDSKWHELYPLEEDKFKINLNVQHFKPDEISVKVVEERIVIVEGRHEEKKDDQGYVSRHFTRTYELPQNYDLKKIKSTLSSDGVLIITVPKSENRKNGSASEEKMIPILKTKKSFKQASNHINMKHKL
ncbi:heat shock protein 23-like [Anoplophora glabripennis]|uniref:heat shock protein 23-like n=1 Tax=Anoplophora glabripennis TaxID=217634 RepID=UPI000874E5F5|nr:heat shock protein 23-like [Anoplophora glabripennis]XP_018564532.1 heat shock protein 23-like [Anoplophora glabripennis]